MMRILQKIKQTRQHVCNNVIEYTDLYCLRVLVQVPNLHFIPRKRFKISCAYHKIGSIFMSSRCSFQHVSYTHGS